MENTTTHCFWLSKAFWKHLLPALFDSLGHWGPNSLVSSPVYSLENKGISPLGVGLAREECGWDTAVRPRKDSSFKLLFITFCVWCPKDWTEPRDLHARQTLCCWATCLPRLFFLLLQFLLLLWNRGLKQNGSLNIINMTNLSYVIYIFNLALLEPQWMPLHPLTERISLCRSALKLSLCTYVDQAGFESLAIPLPQPSTCYIRLKVSPTRPGYNVSVYRNKTVYSKVHVWSQGTPNDLEK